MLSISLSPNFLVGWCLLLHHTSTVTTSVVTAIMSRYFGLASLGRGFKSLLIICMFMFSSLLITALITVNHYLPQSVCLLSLACLHADKKLFKINQRRKSNPQAEYMTLATADNEGEMNTCCVYRLERFN
jgi:hypothetical protein